jgi:drug/metabolite transporter (DMT)-like permease
VMSDDMLLTVCIGPMFKYMEQHGVRPCLAVSWRCQCMCIFLIPILIYQHRNNAIPRISWLGRHEDLKYPFIVYIIVDCFAWSANVITWCFGVKYTTTVRASLFANTHPLMLVVVMYLTGHNVHFMEWFGVFVIMTGIFYSFGSQLHNGSNSELPSTWYGDSLCLVSAFADMLLVLIRSKTTKHMTTLQVCFFPAAKRFISNGYIMNSILGTHL